MAWRRDGSCVELTAASGPGSVAVDANDVGPALTGNQSASKAMTALPGASGQVKDADLKSERSGLSTINP